MDAFENVIAAILQRQGFWTMTSFKVELTKEEKREIGRPSSPRWELDVVAYRGRDNELRVVECKSYLDSPGVDCAAFNGTSATAAQRYKLFSDDILRRVVLQRLEKQLVALGFCPAGPTVRLCLAAGKVQSRAGGETWLARHFNERGWLLLGPNAIREELESLRNSSYENSIAAIVAKMLLRGPSKGTKPPGIDATV